MHTPQVFTDPSGRRKLLVGFLAVLLFLLLAAGGSAFFFSLRNLTDDVAAQGVVNDKPAFTAKATAFFTARRAPVSQTLLEQYRQDSLQAIEKADPKKATPAASATPAPDASKIVAGFYAPWQQTGLNSLRIYADKMTHVMPEWLHLSKEGTALDLEDWQVPESSHSPEIKQIATKSGLQIWPMLNNYDGEKFDATRVHNLVQSVPAQQKLADQVRDWLLAQGYQGLNIDFESFADADYQKLADFLKLLGDTLHKAKLGLSIDLEVQRLKGKPLATVAAACDFIILMAYDEHDASAAPGPISSVGWASKVLVDALKVVPRSKFVLGVGAYGYDWTIGQKGEARSISYQEALLTARNYSPAGQAEKAIKLDGDSLNPRFDYLDENGKTHRVWFLDGVTAYNQWALARKANLRGAAIWLLGSEDPTLWQVLDKGALAKDPPISSMQAISFPYDIEFTGEGEILSVVSEPSPGARMITQDPGSGLITDAQYTQFPSCYVIRRSGYQPKKLALTFDDGPSEEFTPPILDALKTLKVPATFFVLGQNSAKFPKLIQRMWDEGHEIGSHTFTHPNLATVSQEREVLELNGTKRALESILGRSTIWFRPPYQADAEPVSAGRVRPIVIAAHLGYSMVGELIDPQDWNLWKGELGYQTRRTADDLTKDVLDQVAALKANVILLHDAGGDRTATVAALHQMVPKLQAQGYEFVLVSALDHKTREDVMPALSKSRQMITWINGAVFSLVFSFFRFLAIAFIIAIALGIARVAFVTVLALWVYFRSKPKPDDGSYRPLVSVIIPAYNENTVVVRTIRSVMGNDYQPMEIIFVDDGSKDGTADIVAAEFVNNPEVRIIRQPNGGKAAALNNGIAQSNGEIIVGIDADTQFPTTTISRLVQHFRNEKVGAVAGNVKVGNRINLLTRWQALEYISSQNVDRLAYSFLNSVTVVPGAVGAWRRSALLEAGGYVTDTLAEDMDLTWRIRRQGWKIETEAGAIALTEAPATMGSFFKQRFRWSYGTLQCLWKHRGALFRYGWFGWLSLPTLWMFQIVFQVLAPLVDLQVLYALWVFGSSWVAEHYFGYVDQAAVPPLPLFLQTVFFYLLFFTVELAGAAVAVAIDRERWSLLPRLFLQRFVYRQLMYAVLWKALVKAVVGTRMAWGKLERRGTVSLEPTAGN